MNATPHENSCHQHVRIVIASGIHRVDSDLRDAIETRVKTAFRRFVKRITAVRVWLDDVNGPRGGVDSLCRIEVQLIAAGTVTAESRAHTLRAALTIALDRVKRTIDRLLKRRRTRARCGRRSANRQDEWVQATSVARTLDTQSQSSLMTNHCWMHAPGGKT